MDAKAVLQKFLIAALWAGIGIGALCAAYSCGDAALAVAGS